MKIKMLSGEILKTPSTIKQEIEEIKLKMLPEELRETKTSLELGLAETIEHLTEENISLKLALADSYEHNFQTKLELQLALAEVIEMIALLEGGE